MESVMARKDFYYSNASRSQTGVMVCAACNKPITEGDYRYRETKDRFINHHKNCSLDDPQWEKLENQKRAAQERDKTLKKAIEQLISKHQLKGPMDLLHEIDDLFDLDCDWGGY
jgi:hypothetical protein